MAGPSASFVDQDDVNTAFIKNHEHGGKKLCDEIEVMIENMKKPLPDQLMIENMIENMKKPLPDQRITCCIYKVSDDIRQSNKEDYTPQVISIGPFHRNNPKLKEMERFKSRYLGSFLERAEEKLEDIVSTIKGEENSVRRSYSEAITLDSDDFVTMILVDATFIIEFCWRVESGDLIQDEYLGLVNDWSFLKRVETDLILLENQLPFFIIEKIYNTAFPSLSREQPIIDWLSSLLFKFYHEAFEFSLHYLDRNFLSSGISILHFTDLLRKFVLPPRVSQRTISSKTSEELMHSVAQLDEVGLKFKKSRSSNCSWLELKYYAGGRVLEIPRFKLDKTTQIYARNLISFEQYHYPYEVYITHYYFLLRLLIRSQRDVDLFVRGGILVDRVDVDAISVLNKILANIAPSEMYGNYYSKLAEELNKFYKARVTYRQKMMAILKREYFHNPWRGAATIGGIFLLLLTVIQTVCALISVKNWK